jgi:hypothetical protein
MSSGHYWSLTIVVSSCVSRAQLFVVGTTLCNWNFGMFFRGYGPGEAWTGRHFYLNWAVRSFLPCFSEDRGA